MNDTLDENAGSDGSSDAVGEARPPGLKRTLCVVGLLVATALLFSYLGAYAVTNALVAADVFPRWPAHADPRPRRLLTSFVTMLVCFGILALVASVNGRRQMKRIDAMNDEA